LKYKYLGYGPGTKLSYIGLESNAGSWIKVALERMDLYKENRSKIYLGRIPDPLIVESEGLQGSLHKNEQIIISLLVGGGYP